MLYQVPEGSSTPKKQLLPLWQVNVLPIYTESNWIETFWSYYSDTRCWLTRSEYLSACGICSTNDQKTPQHLEIRFCRYDKSMFCQFMLNQAMNTDFLSYCCDAPCRLTRSEYLSACGICSTKDHKAPQHMEIRFCDYDKSMFILF